MVYPFGAASAAWRLIDDGFAGCGISRVILRKCPPYYTYSYKNAQDGSKQTLRDFQEVRFFCFSGFCLRSGHYFRVAPFG